MRMSAVDDGLTWPKHLSELKKGFANKLSLLKRICFLARPMVLDLYNKVILPSENILTTVFFLGGGGGRPCEQARF